MNIVAARRGLCSATIVWAAWFASGSVAATGDVEKVGDGLMYAIPIAVLGTTLFVEDDYRGTRQFLAAFALAQLTTEGLKQVTNKRRPNGGCCKSFPSGHSSAAFVGASFVHRRYGWRKAVVPYLAASYVAYSRVEGEKHFVEDVIAGAVVGIASSFLFAKRYRGFSVQPVAGGGFYGVTISNRG